MNDKTRYFCEKNNPRNGLMWIGNEHGGQWIHSDGRIAESSFSASFIAEIKDVQEITADDAEILQKLRSDPFRSDPKDLKSLIDAAKWAVWLLNTQEIKVLTREPRRWGDPEVIRILLQEALGKFPGGLEPLE